MGNLLRPPLPKRGGKDVGCHLRHRHQLVAAFLFAAVNEIEPDRRLALALKFLIVFVGVGAIAGRLTP